MAEPALHSLSFWVAAGPTPLTYRAGWDFHDPLVAWCSAQGGWGVAALFVGRNLLALILLSGRKTCCCVREAVWRVLVCWLLGKGLTRQACCECIPGTALATDCEASPLSAGQTGMLLADVCGIPPPSLQMPAIGPGLALLSLAIAVCSQYWPWAWSVPPHC